MSNTDKTRPWTLKAYEHPVEIHDHRNGVCDLPKGKPTFQEFEELTKATQCHYTGQWWRSELRCGCRMCSRDAYQIARRIQERIEGKRQARNWRKDYE